MRHRVLPAVAAAGIGLTACAISPVPATAPRATATEAAVLVARADSAMGIGRFDEAIPLLERAVALEPDRVGYYRRLAASHTAVGLFDRAEAWLRLTRERGLREPHVGWLECELSIVATYRGDPEGLARHTDTLLALASAENPRPWWCAAFNEVFLHRYADAKRHLERYLAEAEPQGREPNLGFALLKLGERERGDSLLERFAAQVREEAAREPDAWGPRFELAEIAAMRGRADEALRHLRDALERGAGRHWSLYHLVSDDALPDPVFEPLYGHPDFERIRAGIRAERERMRGRVRASLGIAGAARERVVEVDGRPLHVRIAGWEHLEQGRPVVVFESGSAVPAEAWDQVVARIATSSPVVAYDPPGIGRSPWDGEQPTLERMNARLHALLRALGAPPPYVLVGHSWAGWLVRGFSGRYPTEVAGLVLVDPTPPQAEFAAAMTEIGAREAALDEFNAMLQAMSAAWPPPMRARQTVIAEYGARRADPEVPATASVPVVVLVAGSYGGGVGVPDSLRPSFDLERFVAALRRRQITAPVEWVRSSPDGLLVLSGRSGHCIHCDDPDLVAWAIRRVLSSVSDER